jgi:hypothetical protein
LQLCKGGSVGSGLHSLLRQTFAPQACEMLSNVESMIKQPIIFNFNQNTMLVDTDPGTFAFILIATGALSCPFLYGCFYLIGYFINRSPPRTNNLQLELRPDTRVGCSNGLCYLPMFKRTFHDRIVTRIGHFPSILALTTIPKAYRTKAKGSIDLMGDGVAHFEPNVRDGGFVWDILEEMMSYESLIY